VLDEGVTAELRELWSRVERDWDDRGGHAIFVETALRAGQLGFAARCYRARGDDPRATEQLAGITRRLEAELAASLGTRDPNSRPRALRFLWVVGTVAVLGMLAALGALLAKLV